MTTTTTAVTPEDLAAGAPDERVTSFHVRDVALTAPDGTAAGTMALITMDNGFDHTKPTTYGPNGLLRLRDALDAIEPRVAAGELAAVGITGKPFVFGVGADLKDVGTLTSREQALTIARLGHDQLRRLGELAVPSFAFVNGAAMGGGVEVALHCTYRTISSSVPAVALPECFLGLVPGWGGTYLLPRLVGPAAALEVMVSNALNQNRMLKGAAGVRARHGRRDARAGRLPRAVAALGRVGRERRAPWWSGTTTPPTPTRGPPPSPVRAAS